MRELTVDFNSENPLSGGAEAGYIGENNATKLILKLSDELLASGSSFFVAVFMSRGEIYRSEHFAPAESFEIMLGSHLTQDHYLKVQIEGYSEENMLICKSPMVSEIRLMPSISGCESEIDKENYLLKTQIALNSECRHTHENSDTLSLIGEKNGRLTYNGEIVSESNNEKTVVLTVESGDIDGMVSASGTMQLTIFTYSDAESFVIPADAEIKAVELGIDDGKFPEWVNIEDMFIYDTSNPYFTYMYKPFVDNETELLIVCKVIFLNEPNTVANSISNMCLKKVRITYVESTSDGAENE